MNTYRFQKESDLVIPDSRAAMLTEALNIAASAVPKAPARNRSTQQLDQQPKQESSQQPSHDDLRINSFMIYETQMSNFEYLISL